MCFSLRHLDLQWTLGGIKKTVFCDKVIDIFMDYGKWLSVFQSWDPWFFTVPIWLYLYTQCTEKISRPSFRKVCECVSRKGSRSWESVQRTSPDPRQRLASTKNIRRAEVKKQCMSNKHTQRELNQGVRLKSLYPAVHREKKVLLPIILFTFPPVELSRRTFVIYCCYYFISVSFYTTFKTFIGYCVSNLSYKGLLTGNEPCWPVMSAFGCCLCKKLR